MKNQDDFTSAFDSYIEFHNNIYSHIIDSGEEFSEIFFDDKSAAYVIKCADHIIAFYVDNEYIKASPYISDVPYDDAYEASPSIMRLVMLERPTLLPLHAIRAIEFTDFISLSDFSLSPDLTKKIARLAALSFNEVFSEINDDLFKLAAIHGVRFAHRLIDAGYEESEVLELDEDSGMAALSKVMLDSVLSNNRFNELVINTDY